MEPLLIEKRTKARQASRTSVSPIEEIIEEARQGRMFILVDDEDRENEGDLIIPAQMATPGVINFMAMHGRGLICLALAPQRIHELGLAQMRRTNEARHGTAFTVSIEAREGVTTGISANDRARTIAVAINGNMGPDDIVSPGHVFPLAACEGGVLVRAGHTEAAVDISRLAGLNPSGVICEIMNEDGTMARLDDLLAFADRHDLKVGTIRDLIRYRRRTEKLVARRASRVITTRHGGDFQLHVYENLIDKTESIALVKGDIAGADPVLVRVHAYLPSIDLLGEVSPRSGLLETAMEIIDTERRGVIVLIREWRDLASHYVADRSQTVAIRDYGIGAQILADLGVHAMELLTNSHPEPHGLEGYDLQITNFRPLPRS
jgi:3,4-dihydroxy 2-butanone 4-phosphate synthase / GTP cyclohydrolase II